MMLATWLRGRAQHDLSRPNAEAGALTNRVLRESPKRIATGYGRFPPVPGEKKKRFVTGCPVRTEFFLDRGREKPQKNPFRLPLFTGGQTKARWVINRHDWSTPWEPALAARKSELAIVHQTGERDYKCGAHPRYPRGANISSGRSCPSHQHGGAFCLGGIVIVWPRRGAINRSGNCRFRTRRYLHHPLRARQPTATSCATPRRLARRRSCRRPRDSGIGNSPPERLSAPKIFLPTLDQPGGNRTASRVPREAWARPTPATRHIVNNEVEEVARGLVLRG